MTMITDGLQPPNSFTMIGGEPGLVGVGPAPYPMQMQMQMPMTMTSSNLPEPSIVSGAGDDMTPLMMPSMTMTIQSDSSGGSNIEVSMQNASSPANLVQQQRPGKWNNHLHQQQQQQQQFDHFDEPFSGPEAHGGEQYYSSPWLNGRPLASPAKLLRNERLRKQQQHQAPRPTPAPPVHQTISVLSTPTQRPHPAAPSSGRLQQQQHPQQMPLMPVLVIKNQWHPTGQKPQQEPARSGRQMSAANSHQVRPFNNHDPFQRQIQQQISQALEVEELVPVGPAQLMPIYQTPNGQLHISPPTSRPAQQQVAAPKQAQQHHVAQVTLDQSSFEHEEDQRPASNQNQSQNNNNSNDAEVQTISSVSGNLSEPGVTAAPVGHQNEINQPPAEVSPSPRPSSPATKGKQQQLATKRKPGVATGGY